MADPGIRFRQYQETGKGKWPGKAITITKSKTDYSSMEKEHPDDALNAEYIAAGAADDHETPLCFAVHDQIPCRRLARKGTRFCYLGRGDYA